MKILQVASYYAPTIGGMETVLQGLAEGLARSGDQVTVLCAAENCRTTDETLASVRVLRAASLGRWLSQPLTPTLPILLHRLARDADVIHLHMPNPLAEAAVATLRRPVPLVATYHSDVIRQAALEPLHGPIQRAVLRRCARIVVPTANHISSSNVLPAFADRCSIVPFGISPDRYPRNDAVAAGAARLRARHGKFALFVGRLVYYKGLDNLVDAMALFDGKLVIAGDGPLRSRVERRIASQGLEGRVILTGRLSQADLSSHLDACEVLVLPSNSRSEGFGMVLLEGMLFGKPLVTGRLPTGVQVVNEDGKTGVQIDPTSHHDLARALSFLLSHDDVRSRMGEAARARVATEFTLDRMVDGYRQVYRQVAATHD